MFSDRPQSTSVFTKFATFSLSQSNERFVDLKNNTTSHSIFLQTSFAQALAGVFAFSAILMVFWQAFLHLRFYTCPNEQRWIVRILFIVPVYSFTSWLGLLLLSSRHYHVCLYVNVARDCYEALVIYSFLSLCYEYLGGESCIMSEIHGRPIRSHPCRCQCCPIGHQYNIGFLRFCKQATLQFCFVKPLMAVLVVLLQALNLYTEGDFSVHSAYLYITLLYNLSVSLALYALLVFYRAVHHLLAPYQPVLKFVVVKAVIFLSFWQGFLLAVLEKAGCFYWQQQQTRVGVMAAGYQNFLICLEMLLAAALFAKAFPHARYMAGVLSHKTGVSLQSISSNLRETINPRDIMADAVHNFHPDYQHYTQHEASGRHASKEASSCFGGKDSDGAGGDDDRAGGDDDGRSGGDDNGRSGGDDDGRGARSLVENEEDLEGQGRVVRDGRSTGNFCGNYERLNYSYQSACTACPEDVVADVERGLCSVSIRNSLSGGMKEGRKEVLKKGRKSGKELMKKGGREMERTTLLSSEEELS